MSKGPGTTGRDITARLRADIWGDELLREEAAREIERLRDVLDMWGHLLRQPREWIEEAKMGTGIHEASHV